MNRIERRPDAQGIFEGFQGRGLPTIEKYPAWRYHRVLEPAVANNTAEDEALREKGYDDPLAPISANKQLSNWYWDLEDMSPRQLVVFAKDEFGLDLPIEAGQERLFRSVLELSRWAPQNRGRID